ncbi:MAG: ABC transporter permease [Balneola sp.]|jgi:ABC-2 type transport system permease protein|nr:ABC transporter permease [Balneola sp.]
MRIIRFLLQKEFLQIFRNKAMLPIIFVIPVVQLLVLSFAATYELKEAKFALIDRDQSIASRELVSKLQATGYFILQSEFTSEVEAKIQLEKGEVSFIVEIPRDFQQLLSNNKATSIQLVIDAVDGSVANLINSYVNSIVRDYSATKAVNINVAGLQNIEQFSVKKISTQAINWYNPNLDYITYMVPGILVILVSMIGLFLSGMNIVREREIGTIEQLNVTPITKFQFMVGKLVPFWMIGMFDLLLGLALARFGFQIPFLGSLTTILIIAGIYLVLIQVLGLFISTITDTQQQAMFIAWFIMVVFILMGGLFTPIESMPMWAQKLTLANPIAYFIKIMRMVLLKGAGWKEVYEMVLIISVVAAGLLAVSVNRYKKTSG